MPRFSILPDIEQMVRYAKAGVGPAAKTVPILDDYKFDRLPMGTVGLTGPNDVTFDEQFDPSFNNGSDITSGVIPHELTHYLNFRSGPSYPLARERVAELGTYRPIRAVPSSNQNDNVMEQLAERVAQPYVDARIIAQIYKEQTKKGAYKPIGDINFSRNQHVS